jgi:hypothetical protein
MESWYSPEVLEPVILWGIGGRLRVYVCVCVYHRVNFMYLYATYKYLLYIIYVYIMCVFMD